MMMIIIIIIIIIMIMMMLTMVMMMGIVMVMIMIMIMLIAIVASVTFSACVRHLGLTRTFYRTNSFLSFLYLSLFKLDTFLFSFVRIF